MSAWLHTAQATKAGQFWPWAPGSPNGEVKGHGGHSAGVSTEQGRGDGPSRTQQKHLSSAWGLGEELPAVGGTTFSHSSGKMGVQRPEERE